MERSSPAILAIASGDPGACQRIHDDRHRVQRLILRAVALECRQKLTELAGRTAAARSAAGRIGARSGAGIGRRRVVMMMMMAAYRLREVRDIGELAALGSVGEIGCQLVELAGRGGIPVASRRLRRILQIGGDLLRHLFVLGWVRLLQLLQSAHQLRKG